ncbi:MAG: YbjN domain-containing protein [Alphaproteobacteria bacterium]
MDFFSQNKIISYNNPIDCIEDQIYKFDVETFRDSPNHLTLKYKGSWKNYDIIINWDEFNKVISISSYFDLDIKSRVIKDIYLLISKINEKVNLGYFHYCSQHKEIFFKYQVSTKGLNYMTVEQIEDFLSVVIKECDRFYPIIVLFNSKKQKAKFFIQNSLVDIYGKA